MALPARHEKRECECERARECERGSAAVARRVAIERRLMGRLFVAAAPYAGDMLKVVILPHEAVEQVRRRSLAQQLRRDGASRKLRSAGREAGDRRQEARRQGGREATGNRQTGTKQQATGNKQQAGRQQATGRDAGGTWARNARNPKARAWWRVSTSKKYSWVYTAFMWLYSCSCPCEPFGS